MITAASNCTPVAAKRSRVGRRGEWQSAMSRPSPRRHPDLCSSQRPQHPQDPSWHSVLAVGVGMVVGAVVLEIQGHHLRDVAGRDLEDKVKSGHVQLISALVHVAKDRREPEREPQGFWTSNGGSKPPDNNLE